MDRRRFLKWLGLTPAVPVALAASAKFDATAKALDIGPAPVIRPQPLPPIERYLDEDDCSAVVMVDARHWNSYTSCASVDVSPMRRPRGKTYVSKR